jgi:hypothetical protein
MSARGFNPPAWARVFQPAQALSQGQPLPQEPPSICALRAARGAIHPVPGGIGGKLALAHGRLVQWDVARRQPPSERTGATDSLGVAS